MRVSIVWASIFMISYEVVALWLKWPTWTNRSHHKSGALIWAYVTWLVVHLYRGR